VDPESPESAYERPIVKHKVAGSGPISLNEAVDATHWARGYKLGQELVTSSGLSQSQIGEMAADAVERGQRGDPQAPPPPKVEVTGYFGEDAPLTPREAADQIGDWRERYQQSQAEALQELGVEAAEQAQQEAQQAQNQPEPQPQPQPAPEQTERQQLAQERQRLAALKRAEGAEVVLRNDYDQLVAAVVQEFPGLAQATPADVEQLRVQDPQRHAKLMMADQMLRERQQRIAALAQQRNAREQQEARAAWQQRSAARAAEDAAFERLAAQHIPNWEQVNGELRVQARKTLHAAGLSDDNIRRLWSGDESIDAHSSVLQLILAKAAQWDLATQRAHQIRQTPVPPVMKPGTSRPRNDGEQSVRDLQTALRNAKGREALRIGTALTKARRASGG
jgi:hypothetical protein